MAKRQRIRKIDTSELQGPDSWATVGLMTVAEIREKRAAARSKDADRFELAISLLKTHVFEWDWVDDDGNPWPQPKDDPSVIDELAEFETVFLAHAISGSEQQAKN